MKTTLYLKELQLVSFIGVTAGEKEKKQILEMNLEIEKDLLVACESDDIEKTINYDEVATLCQKIAIAKKYHLIEALAHEIFHEIWQQFSPKCLKITLKKKARSDIAYAAIILEKERK